MYTPQMVINGTNGFIGSDGNLAHKYINQNLQIPASNKITLNIKTNDSKQIEVSYYCGQLTPDTVLNFALVERGLESDVTRGENAGHLLKHDNVVREFKNIPLTQKDGVISFAKPTTYDPIRFSVISYLQNTTDMKVVAADSIDLM